MAKRRIRANGEGTFFKLPDGRWAGVVTIPDENGNPKRIKREGPTRDAVKVKLAKLSTDARQASKTCTVAELLSEWQLIHARKVRDTTAETLVNNCKLLTTRLGAVRLSKLTPGRIQAFIDDLSSDHSARYVRLCVTNLRTALSWAVRKKTFGLTANPARDEDIILPPIIKIDRALSLEQTQALTRAAQAHRLGAIVYLGLRGLRRGEIAGLRVDDLELDADPPRLHIHGAMHHIRGQTPHYGDTKTESSKRAVPLDAITVAALRWFLVRRAAEEKVMQWEPSPYLFRTVATGAPAGPNVVYQAFKAIVERAGLPPATRLHDLRHSVVTFLVAQRVDPKRIAALLGHASVQTSLDLYADMPIESLRDEADLLGQLIAPTDNAEPETDRKRGVM